MPDMRTNFMDFEFETANITFSPRPETELLVEKAVELLSKTTPEAGPCQILDIGTGCGNIAISLAKYISSSIILASDISDTALRVARGNAVKYGVEDRVKFICSDVFENIGPGFAFFFDLIISNPPYVATDDFLSLSCAVKDEPYIALFGGSDGLDFYRRISENAHIYLKSGGILLAEIGYNQARGVTKILKDSRTFADIEIFKDYAGIDRIVKAGRKTLSGAWRQ
ncbi:MAG: protein-(glutamine-N5) methyltransferase, release factor-specific [Omnitrophica bacterium RBG_13_46_9]|nr:MAG: protein-(glutamine-N5) methyltransferase, release factor-specific [Omnitrophica bacterium RBG_13_46_9]